ncbi:hypothetical protein QOZ80_6BG0493070 [Eleusine coracana subsp. coracana]|nr:hypothetical protein QOZ80_6BG0493070 [Eleusine coracana subsp. coracana]
MDGSHDDGSHTGSSHNQAAAAADIIIQEFVNAPASGDPAYFRQVDVLPIRDTLDAWVDNVLAASGRLSVSASAFRSRGAASDQIVAKEFIQRRSEGKDASNDEVCRSVQAVLDTGVVGSYAYCGHNFSVVAVKEVADKGRVCDSCGKPFRVHQPVPVVRPPGPNVEERDKGWLPW